MARFPTDNPKTSKTDLDNQALRLAIIAELDAIDLYEQLAAATSDKKLMTVFLEVAGEEKTHVGEFLELLLGNDKEQVRGIEAGKKEVKEALKGIREMRTGV